MSTQPYGNRHVPYFNHLTRKPSESVVVSWAFIPRFIPRISQGAVFFGYMSPTTLTFKSTRLATRTYFTSISQLENGKRYQE